MQKLVFSETEHAIVESVSRERLMVDTAAIAPWVRLSGMEDERKAFAHVADVLRQLGIEPQHHLGFAYISLPQSANLRAGHQDLHTITHAMAASTPEQGVPLTAVYVGNGTSADFAKLDVRGKAVVIDGLAIPLKVLTAECAGAAACIFANQDAYVHEMIVSDIWGSPTPENKHQQ